MEIDIVTLADLEAAQTERLARRAALLHGALLRIAALEPAEAEEAIGIARRALERPYERD